MLSSLILSLALGAAAAPGKVAPRQSAVEDALVLIGGGPTGTISAATFDGTTFTIVGNNTQAGTSPSWLLFKEPNLLYAVDESSNTTNLFNFDTVTNEFTLVQAATGTQGVVHLEFSLRKDRIVGAGFVGGQIDVWELSDTDGSMTLLKQIVSDDQLGPNAARQEAAHPHQALLDNSGRFFAVNDLGTDTILVIDSLDDAYDVAARVRMPNAGCGPRHAAFFPPAGAGADFPTNYLVVCELTNELVVFQLDFAAGAAGVPTFTPIQTLSTFGAGLGPANASSATAGEIQVSSDRLFAYVSNRNTGNESDSISVFQIAGGQGSAGLISLTFQQSISSGGLVPRMFSLAADERSLFVGNQGGDAALVALARDEAGALSAVVAAAAVDGVAGVGAASLALAVFGASGPQFVRQINAPAAAAAAGSGEVSVSSTGEVTPA